MSCLKYLFLALCTISLMTGCRNCAWVNPCSNGCGNYGQTIAPPATYSMNIPSVSQNQPYYNGVPTTARNTGGLLNPNNRAPTPATNSPTLAPNSGWRPVGNNNYSGTTQPTPTGPQGQSVLASVVETQPPQTRNAPVNRTASAANAFGNSAASFRDSVDYRSTTVDERRDATRLPATDASGVRAPTQINQGRLAQATYTTPNVIASPNVITMPNQVVAQPVYNGTYQYLATPVPVGGSYNAVPTVYGNPTGMVANNGFSASSPTVLAQSTTVYDPRNSAYKSGWRDRELTGDAMRR